MSENVESQDDQSTLEMEAAFAASFDSGTETITPKTVEQTVEKTPEPEVKAEPATPTAPQALSLTEDQLRILSTLPDLERRLTQQVDKVAGNYGEVKRLIDSIQKPQQTKEVTVSNEPDEFDSEFPEIATGIQSKIAKAVSQIPQGLSEEQFESMYVARRQREEVEEKNNRIKVLEESHPDRFEIQNTPEWNLWVSELPSHHKNGLYNSQDPYYVSAMLSKFKTYRENKMVTEKKNKQRVEEAIAPTGANKPNRSTISDEEAAQRAFEEQFK